jgi:hypothetical protein
MKKIVLMIILLLLTGCQKSDKLSLSPFIEDATLKSYDVANNQVTIVHSIEKSKTKKMVEAFENLILTELDSFEGFGDDKIYAVEFEPYYEGSFLLSKNIIVTNEGKFFTYDDDKLIRHIEEYLGNNYYIHELSWFANQRYISIINETWTPRYLIEGNLGEETSLDVLMHLNINHETHELKISIENNDELEIDTGWQYHLEVKLDGKWYNIDCIGKNNMIMNFNSEGFTIFPNMTVDFEHDWEHILPLPAAQYRVRQEITYDSKREFISQEFMILK